MNHPIPAPRRPVDTRPAGCTPTACASCTHRTCRTQRARTLPRLGGHRAEFALEHQQAAALQIRHRGLITWFGEATQSFWVASSMGMYEAKTYDDLLAHLWAQSQSRLLPRGFRSRH